MSRAQELDRFVRKDLVSVQAYQSIAFPGSLPGDGRAANGELVKLDGNVNVYGCSPRVQEALNRYKEYHVYPEPDQGDLRNALAGYTGIGSDHIVCGAGSDELIDLLMRLVLETGDTVVSCPPTFGMYAGSARLCGGRTIDVPRSDKFQVQVDAVIAAIEKTTKAIILASPNNPTGTPVQRSEIERLLGAGVLVIVDEAYYEFALRTVVGLVPEYENLIVLRTFSKWAGLAGLRVGYGIMAPELVQRLMAIKPPYNINAAANVAALESLQDLDYLLGRVRALVEERDRLYECLQQIDYLKPVPSDANFILCRVAGHNAKQLQRWLRGQGVYIRHFDSLPEFVRISVGRPQHTDLLMTALKNWGKRS